MPFFDLLFEPLRYDFFTRGLVVGILLGTTCGALGCFVVLRGLAFVGDAIAHAILPGIVIAYLLGLNIFIGAFGMALLVAGAISFISRHQQLREDTAIGIVFTGAFALGIALISRQQGYMRDLTHFLIGNILGVSAQDVWITVLVTLIVLGGLLLFLREWTLTAFDPTHARAIGLPMGALHFGLMILLSLTIVNGVQAVGIVLIAALLVTPAATARLLTDRLMVMIGLAALLGGAAALTGLFLSYYISIASGAAVVLTSTLWFVIALLVAPQRSRWWNWLPRRTSPH